MSLLGLGLVASIGGVLEAKVFLQYDPIETQTVGASPKMVMDGYLKSHRAEVGVDETLSNLQFDWKQTSLLGDHYHFSYVDPKTKIPISETELILSFNTKAKMYRVFASFPAVKVFPPKKSKRMLSESDAYDIAWKTLNVHGKLLEKPMSELMFISVEGALQEVYQITLGVAAPFGYWRYWIGVDSGAILKKEEIRLTRKPKKMDLTVGIPTFKGPMWNRQYTFSEYEMIQSQQKAKEARTIVDGTALVFDPDPRTSLQEASLRKDSPKEAFLDAYVERALKGISYDGTVYSLTGPWVQIIAFEPPATAPSMSLDGSWSYHRDHTGFQDVMSYFHIDQNQRYIQSLGFKGNKAIQGASIEVDSDGVDGADNSHYIPSSNRISFGHGCIPDNEDADVILHEYGHALQQSMAPKWEGGDTGAMGEGFGDYWAVVYSLSTENGKSFEPNRVFNWDSAGCWSGRQVDRMDLMYNPNRRYGAHSTISGGGSADEMWSTPLVQSFLELQAKGYDADEINRIVLESHFGVGPGLTMRQMAKIVVETAARLEKDPIFSEVFTKRFEAQQIL